MSKFVVIPNPLLNYESSVILTDYRYWADNDLELRQWCRLNNSEFKGMMVLFPNSETLTAFLLRWA